MDNRVKLEMKVNMFVSRDASLQKIQVRAYSPYQVIPPDDFYRIMKNLEWRLFNKRYPTTTFGDKVVFVEGLAHPPAKLIINGYPFSLLEDVIELNSKDHNFIIAQLVESKLKQKTFSLGYERPSGQKYYKNAPYKEDFFSFHDAFYLEVEVFPDGKVGVWADPTVKWKFPLKLFLKWARGNKDVDIKSCLIGRNAKYPSVHKNRLYTGKIAYIDDITIGKYKFEDQTGKVNSVYSYWKQSTPHLRWLRRNNIELEEDEAPLIFVEIMENTKPIPYPPSVIELIIDLLDPIIPEYVFKNKKFLNPQARINKTKQIYELLLENGLSLGNIDLRFESDFCTLADKNSLYGTLCHLTAPTIQFGNGGICRPSKPWLDPEIKSSMFRYGPVSIKDTIPISYICPHREVENIKEFHYYLQKHADKLHLGKFKLLSTYPIAPVTPDRYMRVCYQLGQQTSDTIAIVILPEKATSSSYYAAKKGLGKHLVRSEMVQWDTYNTLITESLKDGVSFSNYNIALKAYGRYLGRGESIWHLTNPAGGLNP
ncbi:MAG: hypothetical protein ACFFDN_31670 [Candidatus Hodarchaeota archaeon]